ncbi:extracellular solute-binding protein [Halegenticoccus tardaugens]|uniref:extracellular solute-binding protein n=1 Tax=Halegenticoccus tardaugens TaxID=2071624 RepID=UPI00100A35D4|nr:extracellular solute-binding protein [Halegenticoccus tardaugens]
MVDCDLHEDKRRRGVSRRSFVKAAAATGAAGSLAGCIYGDGGGGGGSTVVWGFDPTATQDNGDAIKQALHDNGLSDDISVELNPGSQDTGERQNKYNQLLRAKETTPDMFLMDSGWTVPFIQRGQLLNLSEEMPGDAVQTVKNEYFQASVSTAQDGNGNLFGVPMFPDFPTIQYRKDLVEEAGYDPEGENWATEPMTWQRFAEVMKDTQEQTGTRYGFTTQFDIYEGTACCTFNEFMTSWGGAYFGGRKNLFGPVGDRPITVDEQPVLDAIRMVRTFINGENDSESLDGYAGGIAPENILSWQEEDSLGPMLNGDAVANRNWPYAIVENSADDVHGDNLGVMPIPYAVEEGEAQAQGTGGTAAALGGWHMTVNPNTENKDAVFEVMQAAMTEQFQLTLMEIQGWLPPKPKLFESNKASEVEGIGDHMETLKVAGQNAIPRPVTVVWSDQSSAIAEEVNAAAAGDKTPQDAMNALKSQLESIEQSG